MSGLLRGAIIVGAIIVAGVLLLDDDETENPPAGTGIPAIEIVPGTGEDSGQPKTVYRCAEGFKPVEVPVGESVHTDGAKYHLTENKEGAAQKTVHLLAEMPDNISAPAMVINGADYQAEPARWGNDMLWLGLEPGNIGSLSLYTHGFVAPAYIDRGGILSVTICTKVRDDLWHI